MNFGLRRLLAEPAGAAQHGGFLRALEPERPKETFGERGEPAAPAGFVAARPHRARGRKVSLAPGAEKTP